MWRKDCTHGTAELWRYLFGKQTPRLLLCVLRHRGNNGPPLPGDLGLLAAPRDDTRTRNTHKCPKMHKSKLVTLRFNSRLCLWALPDWYYHYYWFLLQVCWAASWAAAASRWERCGGREPNTAGSDEGTHRDVIHWAEEQVSVGVVVDLGLSLEHHSLIVERFDDLWLLLIGGKHGKIWITDGFWSNQKIFWFPVWAILFSLRFCEETHPHSFIHKSD